MTVPPARFHVEEIDLHLTNDGKTAMLILIGNTQGCSITMSRPALDRLHAVISRELKARSANEARAKLRT